MTSKTGEELAQEIRDTLEELVTACVGLDEAAASRAPEGRWTPKEIVSHLLGPEPDVHVRMLRRFLDEDTPTIELVPETTWFTPERAAMPLARLVDETRAEYERAAAFVATLTPEQLARTARIPLLKASPLGEYPTLGAFISGLGSYHVGSHIEHLREVLAGKA
ncbi:hypothetical protein NNJEOMEG_01046 [Fundidesulfovibrio magnetotacticus]|uniref:DinB-like domain-containing protein n=1 Tax=Fundidesulfovibrio magnetotacticus TaxID=2730080 RepID=A0A6V8LY70_9BACT|nr:DinB family protein [Fundidesulfovibrio magnetotacticus]GFK93215.1 hypothetical protein NNJEOMEG_01046 [Fundidesulfovibrio magnetotacticus]